MLYYFAVFCFLQQKGSLLLIIIAVFSRYPEDRPEEHLVVSTEHATNAFGITGVVRSNVLRRVIPAWRKDMIDTVSGARLKGIWPKEKKERGERLFELAEIKA
ncbi:MAG: hypothetical protein D3924_00560 [Candidatus Electrothrix sp. AR4]|nr:hypothetical protein [Candidatus Electrothrix sp. AR4]